MALALFLRARNIAADCGLPRYYDVIPKFAYVVLQQRSRGPISVPNIRAMLETRNDIASLAGEPNLRDSARIRILAGCYVN